MKILLTFSLLSSLALAEDKELLPKLTFYDNPVANAWSKNDQPDAFSEAAETGLLPLKNPEKYNFELAARWNPKQIGFGLKAYQHLMKTGIDPDSSLWKKMMLGLGFTLGYEYSVEPTFFGNRYTRIDRFYMRPEFSVKKILLPADEYKLRNALTPGFELEYSFLRQFQDPKLALLSLPYNEKNVPTDATHAIKGMKEGDLFSFRAALTILVGSTSFTSLASAGVDLLLRGLFDVYIYRLQDNQVRLRMVHVRQNELGAKVRLGISDELQIFGVSLLDNRIIRVIEPELLKARIGGSLNDAVIVDYVMDLNDENVRKVYDEALVQIREYNYMGVVNPLVSFEKLTTRMLLNVKGIQDAIPGSGGKITSLLSGTNKSRNLKTDVKIGNALIKYSQSSRTSANKIVPLASDREVIKFNLHEEQSSFNAIFSLFEKRLSHASGEISGGTEFRGLVLTHSLIDKRFTTGDFKRERKKLQGLLHGHFDALNFSNWPRDKTLSNVEIELFIGFPQDTILKLPDLSQSEIERRLQVFIDQYGYKHLALSGPLHQADNVARAIRKIVNPSFSLEKRFEGLTGLHQFSQYKDIIPGFLLSLIPMDEREGLVALELRMNSTDGANVTFKSGEQKLISMFKALRVIDEHSNTNDLRLRTDQAQ